MSTEFDLDSRQPISNGYDGERAAFAQIMQE